MKKSNYISLSLTLFSIFLIFTKTICAVSDSELKQQEENTASSKRMLQGSVPPPSCAGQCGGCTPCNAKIVSFADHEEWRCACTQKRLLQGSVPRSCVGQCGGCTPCERVSEEVAPGDYIWKCVCKA